MGNQAMKQYGSNVARPQREAVPGANQVPNNSGGHVFAVDIWSRLNRWLILGSEGGSYYASERELTFQNLDAVQECILADGLRTVGIIVEVSDSGRAPKNDQALFALAMCAGAKEDSTRSFALSSLPSVARTGTHLFQFLSYVEQHRKWGRGLRRAVGEWYTEMDTDKLALQVVKYRQREGWTHRDALRKSHIDAKGHAETSKPETRAILRWIASDGKVDRPLMGVPRIIRGHQHAQKAKSAQEVADIITEYRLPRECVPTEFLMSQEVWRCLLPSMPIMATMRNLATMTRLGMLTNMSPETSVVVDRLTDDETITKSRLHPLQILMAMKTYASGQSVRGSNTWTPVPRITDALDECFYKSFGNVPATGKRRLIALDVSGSMSGSNFGHGGFPDISGFPGLSPREASTTMAMVTMKTGDPYEVVAFTGQGHHHYYNNVPEIIPGLSLLNLSARQRLDDICHITEHIYPGGTDCALPVIYADKHDRHFDVIEVYTDSDTWAGDIHPFQALQQYRKKTGLNTKMIVVGMVSNGFSIADPRDPGMLDVVGFDTATPNIMAAFANGEL